ncbi:glycerate kinase [Microbacterium sp. VKM Ac-2923]|uniref:glycerate kinase family protein n=1 Tax=Microbacterium sp. VKM Ac-2923 TaxID=2929476 RepID=UPI001FB2C6FC|nr:glycerate kinase [Microbacterium sp. VKM Ac-2923]MCJ1709020.1 glycerate kinase [Microbacterium sp. VKM Ac-2923]
MRVVIAPDKFKGTLTAAEAADAMASAVRERWPDAVLTVIPMADGGDGTLDALGGANRHATVTGPLGRPVDAAWRLDGGLAVIESAAASGLVLAGGAEGNDPWGATTRGVGELVARAIDAGAERIVVGMGGSATTDGGRGAIEALGDLVPFAPGRVVVLTDTTVTFDDAARVFGPQKGADPASVERLTVRLGADADGLAVRFGRDPRSAPRTGAAGGLSGALFAAGADLVDGAAYIAGVLALETAVAAADLVVTGEGAFDATSLAGKGPGHVLALAASHGVRSVVVAGIVADEVRGTGVVALVDVVGRQRALSHPADAVRAATGKALAAFHP